MPLTLCVAAATVSTLVIPRPALCCWPIVNPAEGVHAFPTLSARAKLTIYGGSSSAGRASDCGSECRGFKSHLPPQSSRLKIGALVLFKGNAVGLCFAQSLHTRLVSPTKAPDNCSRTRSCRWVFLHALVRAIMARLCHKLRHKFSG